MIFPHCQKYFVRTMPLNKVTPEEASRFWKRVTKSDGCWEINGHLASGYGRVGIGGRQYPAHVVSWVLHNGPLPPDKVVAHECDNPRCVRPDHLEAKTQKQNMQDMVARGRDGREKRAGEKNLTSKLTDAQIAYAIESLTNKTETIRSLSLKFGVTFNCIYRIALGKRYGIPAIRIAKQPRIPLDEVIKIRAFAADGLTHEKIAKLVGYSRTAVTKIVNRVTHKNAFQQLVEAA